MIFLQALDMFMFIEIPPNTFFFYNQQELVEKYCDFEITAWP